MVVWLLARPCAAWYKYRHVGVLQPPPGKRRPMFLFVIAYIIAIVTAQIVAGPLWFKLEHVDENTCPIVTDMLYTESSQSPQVGTAYALGCSFGIQNCHTWSFEISKSHKSYWRIGSFAKFIPDPGSSHVPISGFDAFLKTTQSFSHGTHTCTGVYVCCGTVEIDHNEYPVLCYMDGKIAHKRISEIEEAERIATETKEKEARIKKIVETRDKVALRVNRINNVLHGLVYVGFNAQIASKVNVSIDTKTETTINLNHTLTISNSVEEIDAEQMRLDKELKRLDKKEGSLEACYNVHKRHIEEAEAAERKRRAEKEKEAAKRRAEEEARELESRKENCVPCGGSGHVACTCCNGTGSIETSDSYTCSSCSGNGTVFRNVKCNRCSGKGSTTQKCSYCWRSGGIRKKNCLWCGGSGYKNEEYCTACGGAGSRYASVCCRRCGGRGEISSSEKVICPICSGKCRLKCSRCGGNGFTYRPKGIQ